MCFLCMGSFPTAAPHWACAAVCFGADYDNLYLTKPHRAWRPFGRTCTESSRTCSLLSAPYRGRSPPVQAGSSLWGEDRGGGGAPAGEARIGSCTEELWPSFRTRESDGVWKREGTQQELEAARGRQTAQKHVDLCLKAATGVSLPVRRELSVCADAVDLRLHVLHAELLCGHQEHFVLQKHTQFNCFILTPQNNSNI